MTRERIAPAAENGSISGDLGELIRTIPWIAAAIAAIMGLVAIASRQASALFFFQYVALDDGLPVFLFLDRMSLFLTALALGQISGVILSSFLQKWADKAQLIIGAGALKVAAMLVFYFLPVDAVWPQTAAQYVVGLGFGVMMVIAYAMFTDIAEYVDWRSNKMMTGLVVSASIFGIKAGIAIGLAVPGFVMGATGFVSGEVQSETAKMGINLAFALVPAAMLLPGMIAMMFYRLDRSTMATIENDLEARRALPV